MADSGGLGWRSWFQRPLAGSISAAVSPGFGLYRGAPLKIAGSTSHDDHRSVCTERQPRSPRDRTCQVLRTRRPGSPLGPEVGGRRPVRADAGPGQTLLQHPAAAAQRDRHAAHGPRLQPDGDGLADALPPHAGRQHAVGARHRPRRHRHADRRGTPAASRWPEPPRPGPQELRRPRVGMEAGVRQHHHQPDAPPGRLGELGP